MARALHAATTMINTARETASQSVPRMIMLGAAASAATATTTTSAPLRPSSRPSHSAGTTTRIPAALPSWLTRTAPSAAMSSTGRTATSCGRTRRHGTAKASTVVTAVSPRPAPGQPVSSRALPPAPRIAKSTTTNSAKTTCSIRGSGSPVTTSTRTASIGCTSFTLRMPASGRSRLQSARLTALGGWKCRQADRRFAEWSSVRPGPSPA